MFCNACGKPLQPGQNHCPACGQPVGVAVIPRQLNRVAEHSKLLGILWIVYSLFNLVAAAVLWVVANTLFAHFSELPGAPQNMPDFLQPLLTAFSILILVKAGAGLIAGVGLLQRLSWARMLALIMGFISLLNIPIGTALGIYTLWVLLSTDAEKQYTAMAQSA